MMMMIMTCTVAFYLCYCSVCRWFKLVTWHIEDPSANSAHEGVRKYTSMMIWNKVKKTVRCSSVSLIFTWLDHDESLASYKQFPRYISHTTYSQFIFTIKECIRNGCGHRPNGKAYLEQTETLGHSFRNICSGVTVVAGGWCNFLNSTSSVRTPILTAFILRLVGRWFDKLWKFTRIHPSAPPL